MAIAANKPGARSIPATDFLTPVWRQVRRYAGANSLDGRRWCRYRSRAGGIEAQERSQSSNWKSAIQAQIAKGKGTGSQGGSFDWSAVDAHATGDGCTRPQRKWQRLRASRWAWKRESRVAGKTDIRRTDCGGSRYPQTVPTPRLPHWKTCHAGQINTGPIMGRIESAIPTSERQQFDSLLRNWHRTSRSSNALRVRARSPMPTYNCCCDPCQMRRRMKRPISKSSSSFARKSVRLVRFLALRLAENRRSQIGKYR